MSRATPVADTGDVPAATSPRVSASNTTPATARMIAPSVRGVSRSCRKIRDRMATAAGMPAMMTPALIALASRMPNSMQMENRKLPRKDSRNSRPRVRRSRGGAPGAARSQCAMATAAMPKRNQASRNTGKVATSTRENPTYAPTIIIAPASASHERTGNGVKCGRRSKPTDRGGGYLTISRCSSPESMLRPRDS